jgi:tol-pal system protein YbgF
MMMRAGLFAIILAALPLAGFAQDRAQTLADIRQELVVLGGAVQGLRAELSTTGPASGGYGGALLDRVDTIEAALAQLTAKAESLEFRLNQVVTDGTRRVNDIEFRLVELEGGDLSQVGQAPPLGGTAPSTAPAVQPPPVTGGASLATNEQTDFDRAREVLGQGDFRSAADLFATFAQTYTGGPLTAEAHFYRGEALSQLGETSEAARAWLEAFSGDMTGVRAAESLLKVGKALADLGQGPEACVTLQEVGVRFPGDPSAMEAATAALGLGCQ